MANLNGHIHIGVEDGATYRASVPVYFVIPDGATLAQVGTELGRVVTAFNNVTSAKVVLAEMRVGLALPSANDPSGTDLNNAVGLSFPIGTTGKHFPYAIPAAASGALSGGVPVMTEDAVLDVFADILEAAMATTGTTTGFYATNEFAALAGPAEGFRPHRKFRHHERLISRRPGV